jgi:hypothetical protein
MDTATTIAERSIPWNKGKLLGRKPPLRLKEIWAIRIRLQLDHRVRELALFNLAIDSRNSSFFQAGCRGHPIFRPGSILALSGNGSSRLGSTPRPTALIRSGAPSRR